MHASTNMTDRASDAPRNDPNHELVHSVGKLVMDSFKSGNPPGVVTARCGKVWTPTKFDGDCSGMPRCPVCYPKRYQFAIAA